MMNSRIWQALVTALRAIDNVPVWLKQQISMPMDEVMHLPIVDRTSKGDDARPTIEEELVSTDYLDFLREKIALAPRGRNWNEALQGRLEALTPFVDKLMIVVMLHHKPHYAIIRIAADTEAVIHVEIQ